MSWILIITSLKKCYIWLKEYWQVPFIVFWTILVYVVTRRNTDALVEVIHSRKESYKKQIETLKKSHADELLKRDKLLVTYQDAIIELESKYLQQEKQLSETQKEEVKQIVIKSKGNPDEIKKRIQKEFGFQFVE